MNLITLEIAVVILAVAVLLGDLWTPVPHKRKLGCAAAAGLILIFIYSFLAAPAPGLSFNNMFVMDGLVAYRGTKWLWAVDFPPDAELIIKGKTYYAVTKTDGDIYVRKVDIARMKKH